jgi:putative ABC transport system substrate-binding protein
LKCGAVPSAASLGFYNVVLAPMLQAAPTTPIVFTQVIDPVGSGFVESLARPGGNVTGFTQFEYSLAGKWLELLKEMAPRVTRVAVLRDSTRGPGIGQFAVIQAMARPHAVELTPINAHDPTETKARRMAAFAAAPGGGLIVTVGGTAFDRDVMIAAAAKNHLPAIYPYRYFAADGGLMSYGPDTIEQYRRAAGYVDRILKGEKPADLPVQAPTKYNLVINLKTAKALALTVPPTLLATADEVIE